MSNKDTETVTVICIADLQGMCMQIKPEMLPKGDILLIAGDLAGWGTEQELREVNEWLGLLDYKHKIIVAGNHDQFLRGIDGHEFFTNATYLQDELVTVMGLRIYGTPVNDMNEYRFTYDWAFCDPLYLQQATEKIPENLDILLTHGPAFGFLDKVSTGHSVGSKELRNAILQQKPRYHVSGHIHESHGIEEWFGTTFINAAICSNTNVLFKEDGSLYYEPIVLRIQPQS